MERPVLVVLTMLVSAFMVQVEAKHHHHPQSPAPSPSVDCSSAILGLADCLSYVQKGSSTAKPEKSCCTGLEGLVKAGEVSCLCEAFKSSSSLGIALDFNKALGLPSACGVTTPPFSKCGISIGTGSAFAPAFMVQVEAKHHHLPQSPAPSPAVDCNIAILGLADCLSYVVKGSSTAEPEKSCCTGLEGLLKAGEVGCLCEGFKSSSSLGISVDFTKALGLPSACGVSTPPLNNCRISSVTGSEFAPAPSPTSETTVGGGVPAGKPNSQTSGASAHSVGSFVILITIFIATYSLHY
ncbi:Non-specific lipid-transfer protein-like protein [Acorus calamus]|uniref:Non-specific lipid-transfer protein-like protein n=1 Tax=Acorus calamus TaxID=4465 RepID=A0AAV9CPY4_ACOCL|nr:Non-specific lipid-transfer protein-like protein [Acorus calamus]